MTQLTQSNSTISALLALQSQVDALIKNHGIAPVITYGKQPRPLLDTLINEFGLRTDADLARILQKSRPEISKVRCGAAPSDSLILAIHETFDMPVARIRQLAAA